MKKIFHSILQYSIIIVISLIIAVMFRLFVVDFYYIPSDSMAPSIEPGDFILVDKLCFGARMYRNFDFLETGEEPETWRVKGIGSIHHGDVLVFNFPYIHDWNKIQMNLSRFYVKRCIGLPGDTLRIRQAFYEINGHTGFGNMEEQQRVSNYQGEFPPAIYNTFPFDHQVGWNILNFGPLYIPRQGDRIRLNPLNYCLYKRMITFESGMEIQESEGQFYHCDTLTGSYTFRQNWYFMGGDNVWNSQDSRYAGLIPEEFIIGKARRVLTSKDPETHTYKWKRFFRKIN